MRFVCWVDGGSKDNPGPSGIGVVIKDHKEIIVKSLYDSINRATNNEAEYHALLRCLQELKKLDVDSAIIYTDSLLMYNQLCFDDTGTISTNGRHTIFKVKKSHLKKLNISIRECVSIIGKDKITLKYISRKYNQEADALATTGIDLNKRNNNGKN